MTTTTSLPKDIEEILNKHLGEDNESDRGTSRTTILFVVCEKVES